MNQRALFELSDLFATVISGMLEDNLVERGFDVICDEDFIHWLIRHGAARSTTEGPTLEAFYCYVFAYKDGDPKQPSIAAGTALRFAFRLILCSRGAVFWEMMTGMGDAVFAPLYEVLRRRGVRFEFFHRAASLVADDPARVGAVVLEQQARTRGGLPYEPLVEVAGLPCWPSEPLVEQLDLSAEQADRMLVHRRALEADQVPWPGSRELTLRAGRDFDHVILATSIGPLPHIAADLIGKDAALRRCVERVETVATLGVQLWMNPTTAELGWRAPPPILTAFGKPLDTWADMSQVLPSEDWRQSAPRSVQYFCGALPDAALQDARSPLAASIDLAERWLGEYARELFPAAIAAPGSAAPLPFKAGMLYEPAASGLPWHASQWLSANVEPGERYVRSPPGTLHDRPRADGSSFRNLLLAGDWLRTGLDYGCVESAVIGGFQAARAICRYPAVIHGESDFQGGLEQGEGS